MTFVVLVLNADGETVHRKEFPLEKAPHAHESAVRCFGAVVHRWSEYDVQLRCVRVNTAEVKIQHTEKSCS